MHKKILAAILLGTILVTGTGCQGSDGEEKQSVSFQENADESEESLEQDGTESAAAQDEAAGESAAQNEAAEGAVSQEEVTGEMAQSEEIEQEQEAGAAQMEADAIDLQHEKEEIPAESVERTAFTQSALQLDESANWIRVSSENREDGSFGEVYSCEEGLEYEWNYNPSDKADAASGLEEALAQAGWSVSDTSKNSVLSDAFGYEVYNYIAYEDDNGYSMMSDNGKQDNDGSKYEDDNGYSMIHQGLYLDMEGGYYTADFSMMEGNMGMYYEKAETLLSQIYIA